MDLQESSEAFYFIADLHALTVPTDPEVVRRRTRVTAAQFIAGGVDPARSAVFCQSHLPPARRARLGDELHHRLRRGQPDDPVQDKVAKGQNANVGLFTYPMLMAADILMYDADKVPVGGTSASTSRSPVTSRSGSTSASARPCACPSRTSSGRRRRSWS